jgi:hypothetical protein
MTKKIVHQERIGDQNWAGEYHKWQCGCSEFVFFDRGPSFSRKLCGNNHEKMNESEKRRQTDADVSRYH